MHPLVIAGLIVNCTLICINRFVKKKLPDWLYMGGLFLGIVAIIAGLALSRA